MNVKVFGSVFKFSAQFSSDNSSDKSFNEVVRVSPPPSKSHSIRFLLLAALAKGCSTIDNILVSDDISSAYKCLNILGVEFEYENCDGTRQTVHVRPPKEGIFKYAENMKEMRLNVGNSGTLLYMLSILVASIPAVFHIEGDASIKRRPLQPIQEVLEELCVKYKVPHWEPDGINSKEMPQVYEIISIYGKKIEEELSVHLEGKFSQVVSGLLIASSFFNSKINISLKVAGEAPYILMTLKHLKKRGVLVNANKSLTQYECFALKSCNSSFTQYSHKGSYYGNSYIEGFCETVPNDWSAACFLALASIASSFPVVVTPVLMEKEQADSSLLNYLERMGCSFIFENQDLKIENKNGLKASHFNLSNTPDSLPYLAALCSIAKGRSILEGLEICRFKECDRVHSIALELAKLQVNIIEENNKLIIDGTPHLKGGALLYSHGDHRIAMSLIALCLHLKPNEWCIIEGVECCKISYPSFIQTLRDLGVRIEEV